MTTWIQSKRRRLATAAASIAAVAVATAGLAASAVAAPTTGTGALVISPAQHDRGRTLSGQGIQLLAGAGGSEAGGKLRLPVSALEPSAAAPSVQTGASLTFKRGKRSVGLESIHLEIANGALVGSLAGTELPVFRLGGAADVNAAAGRVSLQEGKLRLTPQAAKTLGRKLGLSRALVHRGVGMIWLAAQASPTHAAARPVIGGTAQWGILASWRKYVLGNFGPGSVGTIATDGGASASGNLAEAASYFSFPASGGSFHEGLYEAADVLELQTSGSVTFAKPGHCIIKVAFDGLRFKLDGAESAATLDASYEIGSFNGSGCDVPPAVSSGEVPFATLDLGAAAASRSGNQLTWSGIPATLTEAGGTAWGAGYEAGQALDPVTISVELG